MKQNFRTSLRPPYIRELPAEALAKQRVASIGATASQDLQVDPLHPTCLCVTLFPSNPDLGRPLSDLWIGRGAALRQPWTCTLPRFYAVGNACER